MTAPTTRPSTRATVPDPPRPTTVPDGEWRTDHAAARRALDAAVTHLLATQHPDGWWKGELATNVTMDAEDLLLREFLGVRDPDDTTATARWIRSQQRPDGTWATYPGGPPDPGSNLDG